MQVDSATVHIMQELAFGVGTWQEGDGAVLDYSKQVRLPSAKRERLDVM